MIACDRCRKRVGSVDALRGTYRFSNDIEIFNRDFNLCAVCHEAWDTMRTALIADFEQFAKSEGARRMAEWMSSREVTHDPWSEVPNES